MAYSVLSFRKPLHALGALATVLILGACSSTQHAQSYDIYDPFEDANRTVFTINDKLDKVIAKPIAKTYRVVLPEPARVGVRNVLRNLNTPVNAGNQLLQGDLSGTATDLGRALINTTAGIGGLFDVAGYLGLEYEFEDFGQTLAVWGIDNGPYFIIPLLGPSTLRDSTGRLVDAYADPLSHYLQNTHREEWLYTRWGVSLVDQRESVLDVLDDLESSSIDYYAVMRSSYIQYRAAMVRDEGGVMNHVEIPDYEDE
ncbi:MAG: VacJ family lipoprotein [Rhodospirillales bacterium]|nr:VacJ family lipoprotein [Rhodospirillales bacterium]